MKFRWWLAISAGMFLAGIVIGLLTPSNSDLAHEFSASFEELSRVLVPFSPITAIVIFIRNVFAMLISFFFSPILCLSPLFTLLLNGWFLGFVASAVVQKQSLLFLILGVLPHGIFELPAMIIAQASAFYFSSMLILAVFKPERREYLLPGVWRSLKFLIVAMALLLPAAIIETYVTPLLIGK